MKAVLLAAALVVATLPVACGSTNTAGGGPVLHIGLSSTSVTIDGEPVSLGRLDARLADLEKQGGVVWLLPTPTPPPVTLGQTPLPKSADDRLSRLEHQVLALIGAHHLRIVSGTMPVRGSASPNPSPQSGP